MNKQNKIIVGVVVLILALTVGYAIFNQSLNISGTAKAQGNLDIVFSEVGEISPHGTNTPTATITENGRKLELSEITLDYPTAYVDIPVTIINNGTVDGVLESITVENLETDDIKVTINGIEDNQIVKIYKANDDTTKVKATVRVEWLDKTDTKTESVRDIVVTLNAKQLVKEVVTTSSSSSDNKCTTFTKKDTYEVGDVIAFCNTNSNKSEDFYVIKDNGDTVTALARYSLLVGNSTNFETGDTTVISTDTECYGLQSDKTVFYVTEVIGESAKYSSNIFNGYIPFSEDSYWEDESGNLLPRYGSSYPAEVYDELSPLYPFINNYNNYISETLGKKSISARLITNNELVNLGCIIDDQNEDTGNCSKAPSWVYSTMYSSSTLNPNPYFVSGKIYGMFDEASPTGVRPVITIDKSEI